MSILETAPLLDPLLSALKYKSCVLGVAGGTGSGKTTVARAILDAVGEDRIAFIEQDSYYRDVDWRNEAELIHHNFDHPSALDDGLLVAHVAALKAGHPIEVPIYDFVRHRRTARTRRIEPQPVILVEGILIFVEPGLRELLDFKIYVDTDADLRLIRRLGRDMAERGRTVQDVLRQYLETVRPMHLEFVEPSKRWADIIIPEGGEPGGARDGHRPRRAAPRGSEGVATYTLRVVACFEAAHHLTAYRGAPEPTHGHSWRVEAVLETAGLDAEGMAWDFVEVQGALRELAARLDHRDINSVPPSTARARRPSGSPPGSSTA